MEIELKIDAYDDRQNIICALANNGYKVWTKKDSDGPYRNTRIFVCFEVEGEGDGRNDCV